MISINGHKNLVIALGVTLLIFFLSVDPVLGDAQYIRFFPSTNGTNGTNISCTGNNYNQLISSGSINAANISSMRVNGMWQVRYCTSANNCNSQWITYVDLSTNCFNATRYTSGSYNVTRMGDANQNAAVINLYTQTNFGGTPRQITNAGFNSSTTIQVASYWFTGNHQWTLYDGNSFTGRATCLSPSPTVQRLGYGFSVLATSSISVRSVKYGCGNSTTTPTTTRKPSGVSKTASFSVATILTALIFSSISIL